VDTRLLLAIGILAATILAMVGALLYATREFRRERRRQRLGERARLSRRATRIKEATF
jgi:hypothetical protein